MNLSNLIQVPISLNTPITETSIAASVHGVRRRIYCQRLGLKLDAIRKRNEWTQTEMGKMLGVSRQKMGRILRGEDTIANTSHIDVSAILNDLGVPYEDVYLDEFQNGFLALHSILLMVAAKRMPSKKPVFAKQLIGAAADLRRKDIRPHAFGSPGYETMNSKDLESVIRVINASQHRTIVSAASYLHRPFDSEIDNLLRERPTGHREADEIRDTIATSQQVFQAWTAFVNQKGDCDGPQQFPHVELACRLGLGEFCGGGTMVSTMEEFYSKSMRLTRIIDQMRIDAFRSIFGGDRLGAVKADHFEPSPQSKSGRMDPRKTEINYENE